MTSKIKNWLIDEQEKAINFLSKNGFTFNKIKEFYAKKIQFNGKDIYLRIILPEQFPLKYPKFYVDQKDWYLTYPHIEKLNKDYGVGICHRDNEEKVAIFDGEELIKNELEKIYEIIKNYESNDFKIKDFLEEFDSYWGEKSFYFDAQSLIDTPKLIDIVNVEKFGDLVSTDIDKTKILLENIHLKIQQESKIIFLPFSENFIYPFPKTKSQMMTILEELGYKNFVEENIKEANFKIIFSFTIDKHIHYAACEFAKPFYQPLIDSDIKPIYIKRMDRDRIFLRGGNEKISSISKSSINIAIVGCGSLGASLAFKLAKSGIKKFLLIDPDILKVDNVGRHICGMKYIQQFKVNALKTFLLEQFPDLEIETINKNGIECLNELENTQLIVSAVGSEGDGFEQLLMQMKHSKNKLLTMPVVLTWFESVIAGKIVLIKNTDIDDLPIFIEKITILDESKKDELVKLDMGCNSSYSPYAFIDAENTVLHATLLITNLISSGGNSDEEIWTVFNDTEKYKEYLKDEYKDIDTYSIQKEKLKDVV